MQMTSSKKTASIEFVVDEVTDMLLAYEHEPQELDGDDLQVVLELPLSNIRGRDPAEIQRTLGRLVLSFLNSRSSKGLNLPRDLADDKKLDDQHFGVLQAKATTNTPEAVYDLAVGLIGRGMRNDSWTDIEEGEELLRQSISAGFPAAIKYQSEVWVYVRPRLEQKLKRT